jgi:hypothetical protein
MKKFIIVGQSLINVDEIQCLTIDEYTRCGKLYVHHFAEIPLNKQETTTLRKQLAEMEWIDGIKEH